MKKGWDASEGAQGISSIGLVKKTNAAAYWDNKTTELDIPEVEAELQETNEVVVAEPPMLTVNMIKLEELDKDHAMNVPSITPDGIDISLLTATVRPILDLIETDMHWDYQSLQVEISQNFREKYGAGDEKIEGTRANNI